MRERVTAFHEAGHAVVAAILGAEVMSVRVDLPARCVPNDRFLRSPEAFALIALAGPIAGNWADRWVIRPCDDELRE